MTSTGSNNTEVLNKDKKILRTEDIARLMSGLNELGNLEISDFNTNLAIAELNVKLSIIGKAYEKTKKTLVDKYALVDDKNNICVDVNKEIIFKTIEDKKKYISEIEKLNNEELKDIKFEIKASQLKEIKGLKATTMMKINEFIINDLVDKSI